MRKQRFEQLIRPGSASVSYSRRVGTRRAGLGDAIFESATEREHRIEFEGRWNKEGRAINCV